MLSKGANFYFLFFLFFFVSIKSPELLSKKNSQQNQLHDQPALIKKEYESPFAILKILPPEDLAVGFDTFVVSWRPVDVEAENSPWKKSQMRGQQSVHLNLLPGKYEFKMDLLLKDKVQASTTYAPCPSQQTVFFLPVGESDIAIPVCTQQGAFGFSEHENREIVILPPPPAIAAPVAPAMPTLPTLPTLPAMLANATTLETPGNEPSSLNILFFGDSGTGSLDQWHVAQGMQKYCKKAHCDFGLLLGDNIYQKGATSVDDQQFQTKFEKPYKNLGLEFYVALGNHDTYSGQKGTRTQIAYTQKSQIWNMPARYYQFSQGNADFFAIDSNTFHVDQRQRTWLTSALARSTASWKIVYAHHPVYSTGSHGFFDLLEGGRMRRLRQKLTPILCKYGVDLYLTGHDHHLELNQSQCGVVHVISGASAKARRAYASLKKRWSTINKYARGYKLGFASLQLFSQSAVVRLLDAQGEELFSYPFKKRSFTTAP